MSKPRVFVTRLIPEKGLHMVQEFCHCEVWTDETPPPYEVLVEKVKGVDGLLSLLTDRIDLNLLDAAGPSLRVISQMAVGTDNIDIPTATARHVPVGNTPGVLTETTADFAWALLMAAARRVVEGEKFVQAGRWKTWGPTLLMGQDVHGAILGIIGFGRIGQAVARRARGFSMRILYSDPQRRPEAEIETGAEYATQDELLSKADFITLHTPLTQETYHLISEAQLRVMKPSAVLVNTSRGGVVDPDALLTALHEGWIAAAALDVTEPEPIPADNPLLQLENLIIVPHIASASVQTRSTMAKMAAENLIAGLKGEKLPYCANPEVYQ